MINSGKGTDARSSLMRLVEYLGRKRTYITVLSCLVVFITTYVLILPAITLDEEEAAKQGGIDLPQQTEQAEQDEELQSDAEQVQDEDIQEHDAKATEPTQEQKQEHVQAQKDNVLSYTGKGYEVTANGNDLPDGTELVVEEIKKKDEDYKALYDDALEAVGPDAKAFAFAKFYDISLMSGDETIEPENPVDVTISYEKGLKADDADNIRIVHFAVDEKTGETKAEVLDQEHVDTQLKSGKMTETTFEADSFSVYAVVYTADLSFEIDGKKYEFSIEGGGAIGLSKLIEYLEILPEDEIEPFIENIEDIEFTNPKYMWVGKIEKDIRIGELKKQQNLDVQYAANLKQGNIDAINNCPYKAPDWIIISLKPFTSTETMTVRMKNGETFSIKVTDDQSDATLNQDGTVQTIPNPGGTTIDLFDYWIVDQYRDTAGRDAWPGHYRYPSGERYDQYYKFDYYDFNGNYQHEWDNTWGIDTSNWLLGNGNNQGINKNHNFKFTPAVGGCVIDGTKNVKANDGNYGVNSWTKNASPRAGIVQGTLDEKGYPIMTPDNDLGTDGTSLGYLFDGSTQAGKEAYTGVNQLLYVDPDGYYKFDSNDFNAQFNKQSKTFTVTKQTAEVGNERGFWPFGNQVYWHGMHVKTDFSMPADGRVLSPKGKYNDMVFEFQGDDDTWLYIDGVLVGDGGGIHNQTMIKINFREGTVLVSGEYDVKPEYQSTYHEERYLDDLYKAAGKYDDFQWMEARDENGNIIYHSNGEPVMTFAGGSAHTFDMFYLERGGGESNLHIRYNLVSTTDFSAHKSYHMPQNDPHARLERNKFRFELIGFDNTDLETGFQQAIMPNNGTPTGDGTFEHPKKIYHEATANSEGYTSLEVGATEDGNVNFGNVQVQASQVGMTYRYMVRELVDPDAENADGVKWRNATDEQKAEGGFIDADGITYDGRVYYFTATVRETSPGSGQYEMKKTRYTDSTYSVVDEETKFFSFVNGHVEPLTLKVLKKSDAESRRPLSGAQFSLTRAKHVVTKDDEGHVTSEKWVVRPESTPKTGTTSNGTLSFGNLTEGHYILEETAAPQGYTKNETYRWLLTLTKEDSANVIVLVPTIRPLNAAGEATGEAVELDVNNQHVIEHEVLNEKLPRGPLTVEKKWLKPDGETEYTAAELAELGNAVQNTEITGQLWRNKTEEAAAPPTVSIYSKLNNEDEYQLRWQEQVEPGSDVSFSMAVNGTGYPINKMYTTDTGDSVVEKGDQDIHYDYISGNQIHKPSGHVFALEEIDHDVKIYGVFDSSQASSNNNPRIGFKMISYTQPSQQQGQQVTPEKVGDFALDKDNGWKKTWTSEDLNEDDCDYEYYLKEVSEPELEGFIFIKDPEITTETQTGSVTYAVKNIKEGPMTDLTVRKVWGDSIDHSNDTISYKIQRSEFNAEGGAAAGPYDYIEIGKTKATVYTLSAEDTYKGTAWQKHHDKLPATNGKDETDPDYRTYQYSVVEVDPPSEYTASYLTITEPNDDDPYEVSVIKNTPKDARVSVEKKWMDNGKNQEITNGIPDGAYITGTLKKSYTVQEAASTTVRVYNQLWSNGQILSTTLYKTYNVQSDTDFRLWAIDSSGNEPLNGIQERNEDHPDGISVAQTGAEKTFSMGGWYKTTSAFVIHVSKPTDIILDWAYNTGFQNGMHYDVDYTQPSGGGQSHEETEEVGTFRIDASNDWKWVWTDRELDQDHVYTYFFENVKEHKADGTVVASFDGFKPPEVGNLSQGADGKWTCTIINEQENLKTNVILKKVDNKNLNKENLTSEDLLSGAKFKLEKYLSLSPEEKDTEWNSEYSVETTGDGAGTFTFNDLPVGYYKIIETDFPKGYSRVDTFPVIEIRKVEGESRLEVVQVEANGIRIVPNQTGGSITIIVGNEPGIELPNSGGPGTTWIYLLGSMLLLGCGITLAARRRTGKLR